MDAKLRSISINVLIGLADRPITCLSAKHNISTRFYALITLSAVRFLKVIEKLYADTMHSTNSHRFRCHKKKSLFSLKSRESSPSKDDVDDFLYSLSNWASYASLHSMVNKSGTLQPRPCSLFHGSQNDILNIFDAETERECQEKDGKFIAFFACTSPPQTSLPRQAFGLFPHQTHTLHLTIHKTALCLFPFFPNKLEETSDYFASSYIRVFYASASHQY
nr:hypothetical transcript [Hymenolepis microstoma]